MRPSCPVGEQQVDDRLADRPRACRRRAPGASAGPGPALTSTIDAPLLLQRAGRCPAATTSTPATSRPTTRAASTARAATSGWTAVGHVGGGPAGAQVGVAADQDAWPRPAAPSRACSPARPGRPGRSASSLILLRAVAWPSLRRGSRLTASTSSATVESAVADDLRRLAARGGDELAADDQEAVVGARGEPLDDDAASSPRGRRRRRRATCSRVRQVGGDPAALVAVLRLDDDRRRRSPRRRPRRPRRRRPAGPRAPARRRPRAGARGSAPCPGRSPRRWRRCGRSRRRGSAAAGRPWPSCTRLSCVEPAGRDAPRRGRPRRSRRCSGRAGPCGSGSRSLRPRPRRRTAGRGRRPGRVRGPLRGRRGRGPPPRTRWRPCRRPPRRSRGPGRSRRRCRPASGAPARRAPGCGPGRCPAGAARRSRRGTPSLQRCSISVGSQAISRSLKPGSSSEGESLRSPRSTQASRTGKLAQMFGPRRARIFRNSMPSPPRALVRASSSAPGRGSFGVALRVEAYGRRRSPSARRSRARARPRRPEG